MLNSRDSEIINIIRNKKECSSKEIFDSLSITVSYATVKRILTKLNAENLIETKGKGKGTKYLISSAYELIQPIDINEYYKKEIDEREIRENFNFRLITDVLGNNSVFTEPEIKKLEAPGSSCNLEEIG